MRYSDGSLTAAEREAVEQWLEGHPEAAAELQMFADAPRLERDETVKYGGATLRRTAIPLWPALRWSAAAAVVAAIVLSVALFSKQSPMPEQVASVEVPALVQQETVAEQETLTEPTPSLTTRHIKPVATTQPVEQQPESNALPEAQEPVIEVENYHPTNTHPQVAVYVEDMIVYADEPEEEVSTMMAQANIETQDNGISVPRLVGALLRAGINR